MPMYTRGCTIVRLYFMHRYLFLLVFLTLLAGLSSAQAQSNSHTPVYSPWMEEEITVEDTGIEPLRLDDLSGEFEKDTVNRSAVEKAYSKRIIDDLDQYGYELFDHAAENLPQTIPAGAVQDSYIVSAGDTLDIIVRGQESKRAKVQVDREGMVIMDMFTPVAAAGKTLRALREELQSQAASMHNTEIYVSLHDIRQIGVLVVGHVKKPGRKTLTTFHTVLDALNQSGGIEKTGSLRGIKLIRGGKSYFIDLYHLLMKNGGRADMLLKDGDRIVIPPLGPTVAVGGFVKRPGIYELQPREKLSLRDMLGLGGNVISPGKTRYIKLDTNKDGKETVQDIEAMNTALFSEGSILMVSQAEAKRMESVTLTGHTREPGTHDLKRAPTLSALISSEKILGADIYPLIGIIERTDPDQLTKNLLPFSPRSVLQSAFDRKLSNGDIVHLFSNAQIRKLGQEEQEPLLKEAAYNHNKKEQEIDNPLLRSFLLERAAFVRGAVRVPGAYPVADGATLENVLAIAGGITLEGNKQNIEVTSRLQGEGYQEDGRTGTQRLTVNIMAENPEDVLIGPGDTVRVNQAFHRIEDKSVTLLGEVRHPGRYDLMPGDTLSTLIERAGGLEDHAYPPGAVFSRASERKAEENRFKSKARDLEMKLAASMQNVDDDKKPDMAQVASVESLITELKTAKAVGRITVEADPGELTIDPDQDILLEAGDRIFIPKRPMSVRVAGEVLSPAALQFQKGKDAYDYVREAGGTTYYADKGRSFVIYPDGSAAPLQMSAWQHSAVMIPPGSTIIVPRDPKPFDFLDSAERISQVLANLAISGLYVEAIGDDD
jgi:polysaccharide export outer membrane protein